MAELRDCPDCQAPLSRSALSCPACGCTEVKNGARLRYSGTTLQVVVTAGGDEAQLPDAVVLVDGALVGPAYPEGKPIRIPGLTTGEHQVVIADRSCMGKRYTLQIQEGEARTLDVQLSRRDQ